MLLYSNVKTGENDMGLNAYDKGTSGLTPIEIVERRYGVCSRADSNNNKYYSVELQKSGTDYQVFVSYGRIGDPPTEKEYLEDGKFVSEYVARKQYEDLLKSKFGYPTCSKCGKKGNAGDLICICGKKLDFRDYTKKYVPVDLAQAKIGSTEAQNIVETDKLGSKAQITINAPNITTAPQKTMDNRVSSFLTHIYYEAGHAVRSYLNTGALKSTIDNPLGTLSQAQLDIGVEILEEIRKTMLSSKDYQQLMSLTSGFYTAIPQQVSRRPDWNVLCINTDEKLNSAFDLIELLGDVKGVQNTFHATSTDWDRYENIGANIVPIEKHDPIYKKIEKGVLDSRSSYHQFSHIHITDIYDIRVKSQKDTGWFDPKHYGNVQPLYHGSRNANILGIMSKGLLLRPPGVVITGSMFGAGLYFGSNSSKSLQYSTANWGRTLNGKTEIYIFVCSVALGNIKEYYDAQLHLTKSPTGYHSVKGCVGRSLIHDEYIIYEGQQHRLDYVVKISV